jgi:hypothetical protein
VLARDRDVAHARGMRADGFEDGVCAVNQHAVASLFAIIGPS